VRLIDLDTWQEVFSTLQKNVLRTVMTAWGVFWGTFMLVVMLGFGSGLEVGVNENMLGFSANNVYAWGQNTTLPYAGLAPGRWVRLDVDDVAALRNALPGAVAIAPGIELGGWRDGNNVSYREKTGNFGVKGESPELAKVSVDRPYLGRFINELDMERRRKVTVIGQAVRRMLFPDEVDPIGEYVRIRGVHFQVVGVMDSEQPGDEGERNNGTLVVPFTTFQAAFNTGDRVGWIGVRLADGVDGEEIERAIKATVGARHRVHPDDPNAVGSFNLSEKHLRAENLFRGIRAFVWLVCIATLLAGALGVSNIMLISVKERTREFGVRKALGATPASIVRLVLQEATVLTALAGYLGLVAGVLALELVARYAATGTGPMGAPSIDLTVALIATAVLGASGAVAGIAPARHAARIHPVVALRSE
jgi:putative ABC transport system permease protein